MLTDIWNAENKDLTNEAIAAFEREYGAKFPSAVVKVTNDSDGLLRFYDYPAEHWVHLRTTNPIESTFAMVRLRTRVTKDGSRAATCSYASPMKHVIENRSANSDAYNLDGIKTSLAILLSFGLPHGSCMARTNGDYDGDGLDSPKIFVAN